VSFFVAILNSITAIAGIFGMIRAFIGPIRGKPETVDIMTRVQTGLGGLSLLFIALFVAAPIGFFGAWMLTMFLATVAAIIRPDWMIRGRRPSRMAASLIYLGLTLSTIVLATTVHTMADPGTGIAPPDSWMVDVLTLGTLLIARKWLWFWRKDAPFRRIEADPDEAKAQGGGDASDPAWWDHAWARRRSGSKADAAGAPWSMPDDEPEGPGARRAGADPAAADAELSVPGYDPGLLAEELATYRNHVRLIDRVAITWPDHPVAEALVHVSVILNETRRYLQDHPDKYRDLRPILVGHATTAADIAGLVDRIKGSGETLDDAEGVAKRLFALASLMRQTRRKSTQAERDRLKASMAVIDNELTAMSAMQTLRTRMNRDTDPAD